MSYHGAYEGLGVGLSLDSGGVEVQSTSPSIRTTSVAAHAEVKGGGSSSAPVLVSVGPNDPLPGDTLVLRGTNMRGADILINDELVGTASGATEARAVLPDTASGAVRVQLSKGGERSDARFVTVRRPSPPVDPGAIYDDSAPTFDSTAPMEAQKFPWMWVGAGAAVLVAGGGAWWYLRKR